MIRPSNTILLLLLVVPSSMGFSRNSMEAKKRISWSEYKHDFIDPIASSSSSPDSQVDGDAPLAGHIMMDPAQRQKSDEFWLAYFDQEKQRLHELNEASKHHENDEATRSLPKSYWIEKVTSYDVYKSKYLDPIAEEQFHHPSGLEGPHVDPERRAAADEFWLQVVMEEKAKLHGKSATP